MAMIKILEDSEFAPIIREIALKWGEDSIQMIRFLNKFSHELAVAVGCDEFWFNPVIDRRNRRFRFSIHWIDEEVLTEEEIVCSNFTNWLPLVA